MTEGRVLADRYELVRTLGRGGMAEVWAAHDQVLGRDVAVKILLERFRDDEAFIGRFHDEARHVARLNHPNLVAVYDTGTAAPPESAPAGIGQPFIVMELVEGRSMQDAIAAGGLTEDRALEVCADVCAALGYAHDRGLVHRDIKPGNILLAEDGTVKVTDFGIARAVDSDTVTRTAAVLGTAAYLSPEQAQGLEIDARSDLYSLGVVLYEALTGRQPFQGDSPVTVAYQHVQEPPRPPHEWNADVSPAAEAITMRALAKNPANRYPSALDMRADLVNARSGQPVAAPAVLTAEDTALLEPPAATRPVRSPEEEQKRRRWVYVLLTILAVLAVVGAIWYVTGVLAGEDGLQVSVPEVMGLSLDEAELALDAEGLELGEVDHEPSDDVEEGLVIGQSPDVDEVVAEGSSVDLVVSTGQESTEVPDLEGVDEDTAMELLRDAGLRPGSRSGQSSDDVDTGEIISSDPAAGTEVAQDTAVDYVVSTGEATVVVRSVVNFTEGDAISRLEDQGLGVEIDREFNDVVAEGTVIRQDPTPGNEVSQGATVEIVVSRGPEEDDEPEDDEPEDDEPEDDEPEDEDEDEPEDDDEPEDEGEDDEDDEDPGNEDEDDDGNGLLD